MMLRVLGWTLKEASTSAFQPPLPPRAAHPANDTHPSSAIMARSSPSLANVLASGGSYSSDHGSFFPSSIRPDPTSGMLKPPRRVSYTLYRRFSS